MSVSRSRRFRSSDLGLLAGPTAPDQATTERWNEAATRRRLLEGLWRVDLRDELHDELEPRRRRAQGRPDTTRNLFRQIVNQLAVLYDQPPIVTHADTEAVEVMNGVQGEDPEGQDGILTRAGFWQLAVTLNRNTIGQREGFYRFDVPPVEEGEEPKLLVRVVPTDVLWLAADPDCPDEPHTMHEYRLRKVPAQASGLNEEVEMWTRDVLSVEDPDNPIYRVESMDGKLDFSGSFLPSGGLSGDNYPYRKADGTPILPGVLYHARRTGKLWDPWTGVELVDGTFVVAILWTMWRHLVRDASWPQRWGINVTVAGVEANPKTGDVSILTDPASVLNLESIRPDIAASVGQFDPGGDPRDLGNAIRDYAADVAGDFDMQPSDIKRTHTDARSGYAIEISRDGQRQAIRRQTPSFQRGDEQSLAVIAALWNRATGSNLPEEGWGIHYRGLPLSLEEKKLLLEEHKLRADLGITSKVILLADIDGMTEDQARRKLLQIEQDEAAFASSSTAPPPPQAPPGGEASQPEALAGGNNPEEPEPEMTNG